MQHEFLDVIPVLVYSDIRKAHDFLITAFGFGSGGVYETDDGKVIHAEVRLGGRRIWLHETRPDLLPPAESGVAAGGLVVHVADVDAHFAHAKASGATIMREPEDEDYGQREYGARDLEGHNWYFATPFD